VTATRKTSAYTYDARRPPHPERLGRLRENARSATIARRQIERAFREKATSATIPRGIATATRKISACTYDARRAAAIGRPPGTFTRKNSLCNYDAQGAPRPGTIASENSTIARTPHRPAGSAESGSAGIGAAAACRGSRQRAWGFRHPSPA
jgi:hypothetical protein